MLRRAAARRPERSRLTLEAASEQAWLVPRPRDACYAPGAGATFTAGLSPADRRGEPIMHDDPGRALVGSPAQEAGDTG